MKKTVDKIRSNEEHSKNALRTWLRLLSCESVIEQTIRSRLREAFSVTLPQFDVLSELERACSPLTMSELSRELMVSNGNVTGVIDRLERNGYVKRSRPAHDRRVQYIDLTPKGRSTFDKMARQHEKWVAELLGALSDVEMERLQKLLLKMRLSAEGK